MLSVSDAAPSGANIALPSFDTIGSDRRRYILRNTAQFLANLMRLRHTPGRGATASRGLTAGARFAKLARVTRSSLLVAAAIAVLVPGCEIDCFDNGELEASYREGQDQARRANAAEYELGRMTGLSLTRQDGLADGSYTGYSDGHLAGYYGVWGYSHGYNFGYADGDYAGSFDPTACSEGANDGLADGEDAGFSAGSTAGYDEGWYAGYDAGWDVGASTCDGRGGSLAREDEPTTDPADRRTCRNRGYDAVVDRSAYERGFSDGKLANPDYSAGYREAYSPAFARGEADGEDAGYSEGYAAGYSDGYDDSAYAIYDACYRDAWNAAYGHGYEDGWASGNPQGYSDGHAAGYEDGAACE